MVKAIGKELAAERIAHLVDLSIGSISNNFNEFEDSSWVLGRKKEMVSIDDSIDCARQFYFTLRALRSISSKEQLTLGDPCAISGV